jgi:hypothetical protein
MQDRSGLFATGPSQQQVRPCPLRPESGSKIHAIVDANGLSVQLGLTPGETHDNRLCPELLAGLQPQSMLLADRGYDADWIRALVRQQGAWPTFRQSAIERSQFALALTCIARVISSSGSSTRSSSVGVSPPATTNSQQTTSPSSNWQLSASGCVFMSPRPNSVIRILKMHQRRKWMRLNDPVSSSLLTNCYAYQIR